MASISAHAGHYLHQSGEKTLELWLEDDGFFRLKFEEKSADGFASNEEKGTYSPADGDSLTLAAVERQWKWQDAKDGDSGVDATDLQYPARVSNGELVVKYLEIEYPCKRV